MHKMPDLRQASSIPDFQVLGVRVHAIQIPETIAQIEQWIASRDNGHYVAFTGMHGVTEARRDASLRHILNTADLVVPDGMPLVWLGRWHNHPLRRRVYGPELMQAFCEKTRSQYRHFFYGGNTGVANDLAQTLRRQYGIIVAGTYTPPFRPLSLNEENEIAACVNAAAPDLLWVGLSTPKQERWMFEYREKLTVPVMLGVGAAFDLNSGKLRQAPAWMRENGLEWLFRLLIEPRRLWKRYLVAIPTSMWNVFLELLHSRKTEQAINEKYKIGESVSRNSSIARSKEEVSAKPGAMLNE
jgi:N-acetylglucosaminyldiphosphoundecaprenol N-acetyl-beta-D-mannosaminyltransferase